MPREMRLGRFCPLLPRAMNQMIPAAASSRPRPMRRKRFLAKPPAPAVAAAPVAPPGSRLLVNKLLNRIRPAENVSFHELELYYVMTPRGFTCAYL